MAERLIVDVLFLYPHAGWADIGIRWDGNPGGQGNYITELRVALDFLPEPCRTELPGGLFGAFYLTPTAVPDSPEERARLVELLGTDEEE